jgi:hypothetical protein
MSPIISCCPRSSCPWRMLGCAHQYEDEHGEIGEFECATGEVFTCKHFMKLLLFLYLLRRIITILTILVPFDRKLVSVLASFPLLQLLLLFFLFSFLFFLWTISQCIIFGSFFLSINNVEALQDFWVVWIVYRQIKKDDQKRALFFSSFFLFLYN